MSEPVSKVFPYPFCIQKKNGNIATAGWLIKSMEKIDFSPKYLDGGTSFYPTWLIDPWNNLLVFYPTWINNNLSVFYPTWLSINFLK